MAKLRPVPHRPQVRQQGSGRWARCRAEANVDALLMRVQVQQRVFVLAGGGDWLIPSADEAEALQALLPHCRARVLPLRSHALLQDSDMDLAALLREEGFYTPRRVLSGNGADLRQRSPGLGTFGRHGFPRPPGTPSSRLARVLGPKFL